MPKDWDFDFRLENEHCQKDDCLGNRDGCDDEACGVGATFIAFERAYQTGEEQHYRSDNNGQGNENQSNGAKGRANDEAPISMNVPRANGLRQFIAPSLFCLAIPTGSVIVVITITTICRV